MTHHLHFFWSRLERLAGAILQAVAGPARGASARRRDGRSPLRDRLDVAAASGRLSPELRRLISEPATDLELAHQLLDDLGIPRRVPAAAAITVYTSTPGDHRA